MLKSEKNIFSQLSIYFSEPNNLFYFWLLGLSIISYGLLIPLLGFYWDDIPYLYLYGNFGAAGFPEFVSFDRPFSAWIFMLTTSLFKFNPIGYHILALILRFISAVLFSKIVAISWPENNSFRIISTSLFLLYPGFLQQPIALIYNHHLSVLCLFLFSVFLMLENIKKKKKNLIFFILSILASLHLFSIENFATLELIRPVLIFIVLHQDHKNNQILKKTFLIWIPYLMVFISFLIWRILIFSFPSYQPGFLDVFSENPQGAIKILFSRVPLDFYTSTIGAWIERIKFPSVANFGKSATLVYWGLVFLGFFATYFFLLYTQKTYPQKKCSFIKYQNSFLIGFFLFLLAGSIVWVLGLPLEIVFAWDRMTLAFIPATAIMFACILTSIESLPIIRNLVTALLISLAVGSHFQNSMEFKRDWDTFKDFLWQLSWRIPDLKSNTTLIGSQIGLDFYSDNSLTPAINFIYRDVGPNQQYDYLFYYTEVRFGTRIPEMKKNIPLNQSQRSFYFEGNTSDIVAIRFKPPGCLQVMDSVYSNSITNLNLSDLQVGEIRLSNLNRIIPDSDNRPPAYLVGDDPKKSWCYYFQNADLARQVRNYEQIVSLGDEAVEMGLSPRIASEWLPFLEGYLYEGHFDSAKVLADSINNSEDNFKNGLCYTLRRIKDQPDFNHVNELANFIKVYNCN